MSTSNSGNILDEVYEGFCEQKLNNTKLDSVITFQEDRKIKFENVNNNDTSSHVKDKLKNEIPNVMHVMKIVKNNCGTEKVWECNECNKVFKHQHTLLRHLPTHTEERKYKCANCGKAFRQKSSLSQHQVVHSDTRPFVCQFCRKTFNRMSTLKSHQVLHSNKTISKAKGFYQKENLIHHSEERQCKCRICGKEFNQKSDLINHTQFFHHNITPLLCPICNREFTQKYVLRAHEEYVHGIKYRGGMYIHRKRTHKNNEITLKYLEDIKSNNSEENKSEINVIRVMKTTESEPSDSNNSFTSNDTQSKQYVDLEKEEKISTICPSITIDPIQSEAMLSAKYHGQTPIALLKTSKGESVLVKVKDAANNKQMLVPATAQDLKSSGTITSVASFTTAFSSIKEINAIHIQVPIVATMIQGLSESGQLYIEAEVSSENPNLESSTSLKQIKCCNSYNKLCPSVACLSHDARMNYNLTFDETKDHKKVSTLHECSVQVENNIAESFFTGVTDSELSKPFSEILTNEGISFVETIPSKAQDVPSSLHSNDSQNMHQVISVQIENEENEPCQCNSVTSSDTLHTPNKKINDSKVLQTIEYETNHDGNQFVISASNKIMLLEYDADNSLQHIVFAKPEDVFHNSKESAQCVVIDPIHLVLQEKK